MFKHLYTYLTTLHINFKSQNTLNLYAHVKQSIVIKNYLNYLNFNIAIFNTLKSKTIQTSFWNFSLDSLIPAINAIVSVWILLELFIFNV